MQRVNLNHQPQVVTFLHITIDIEFLIVYIIGYQLPFSWSSYQCKNAATIMTTVMKRWWGKSDMIIITPILAESMWYPLKQTKKQYFLHLHNVIVWSVNKDVMCPCFCSSWSISGFGSKKHSILLSFPESRQPSCRLVSQLTGKSLYSSTCLRMFLFVFV